MKPLIPLKPKTYSFELAQRIVAKMKADRCSMAKACSICSTLPSYTTARAWLTQHAEFRAIYPDCYRRIFAGRSEADIQESRKAFEIMALLS